MQGHLRQPVTRRALLRRAGGSAAVLALGAPAERFVRAAGTSRTAQAESPAGRRLQDWLTAFGGADLEQLTAFWGTVAATADTYPPDFARRQALQDVLLSQRIGGYELSSVRQERSSDHAIVALLHTGLTDVWEEVTLEVERADPYRPTKLELRGAAPPPGAIDGDLEAYFVRLAAPGVFSGSVLVRRNGRVVIDRAYGLADREAGVPNRTDTRFNIGSMSKMFTAVAVGQLVEQGKLAFGDTLARLLPDRPLDAAERMTVHHLLTHTSGLGDFFGPRFDSGGKDRLHTVWDYLALFEDAPVAFEPGSQFSYSNAGFVVLGAVVERVSGLDYFEYVRQRVYGPSGMRDSDSFERDAVVPNLAVGYTNFFSRGPEPGPARPNTETLPSRGGPAGGGYSTTGDLLRFADALLGHTLVGPEMTGLLTSGKVDTGMGPGARYGYGFLDERFRGARVVGHNGGAPGINATLNIYPDAGLTVALMANVDAGVMHPERHLRDVLTA